MISANSLKALADRRILITGSTGFKGSWLCTWLTEIGAKVSGFALPPEPNAPLFNQLQLDDRIEQYNGDIRETNALEDVISIAQPEIVIHLAAQALVRRSYIDPKATFDTNIGGAINLMEAVRRSDSIRALLFITSDKCYKNKEWIWGYRENDELGGEDPYSASKAAAELVFQAYFKSFLEKNPRIGAVTARAGNVIGGGDMSRNRIVPDCIRALRAGVPIQVRNPLATRPWQHVMEPLSGYLTLIIRLLDNPKACSGHWNFGPDSENVRPVKELAEKAIKIWGSGQIEIIKEDNAPHESRLLMLSSDKAKLDLCWQPRWDFSTAVEHTVEWYRNIDDGADPITSTIDDINNYLNKL